MILLYSILIFLLLIAGWLLLSPLVIKLDTRIPQAVIQWKSIGNARVWHEHEWWLSVQILFYRRTIRMDEIKSKPRRIKSINENKRSKKRKTIKHFFKRIVRVLKTFRVTECKLAVDTGDYKLNGQIYPLNFLPFTAKHISINFSSENYLVLKTRSNLFKILYHFLR